jgi:hypothetical protein
MRRPFALFSGSELSRHTQSSAPLRSDLGFRYTQQSIPDEAVLLYMDLKAQRATYESLSAARKNDKFYRGCFRLWKMMGIEQSWRRKFSRWPHEPI